MVKIELAPLNIPLSRRLQTASCLQWVLSFLFLAQSCACLYVVILMSRYYLVAGLYAVWLYLDWDTPEAGGRRLHWVQSWTLWKHFRDYFPINLIKTCDLDPGRNYLFGFHPHGVLAAGAFGNFCTDYTGFRVLYPGMTPYLHSLSVWFRVPFFREYVMSVGVVSSSKQSISHVLGHKGGGNVSVVVIGGAAESLLARPGSLTLEVLSRKGFVKMALKCGADLVPVFSFGENDIYHQLTNPQGSLVRAFQEGMRKTLGFSLPLFYARGVFQYSFGLLPFRKPIYTVVGKPIAVARNADPSPEVVNELHSRYLDALSQLFEEHKSKYGIPEKQHLIFR